MTTKTLHRQAPEMKPARGDESCDGDTAFDLAFPPVPSPSPELLAVVGETLLCDLVRGHHERLRSSSIGKLFPADMEAFAVVVERIAAFIVKVIDASSPFAQAHGPTWLRAQHLAITIDETARNVWLAQLLLAFEDVGFPDEARLAFWNWAEALSIFLINRRTMITQPRRYTLAEAPTALRAFMGARQGK